MRTPYPSPKSESLKNWMAQGQKLPLKSNFRPSKIHWSRTPYLCFEKIGAISKLATHQKASRHVWMIKISVLFPLNRPQSDASVLSSMSRLRDYDPAQSDPCLNWTRGNWEFSLRIFGVSGSHWIFNPELEKCSKVPSTRWNRLWKDNI